MELAALSKCAVTVYLELEERIRVLRFFGSLGKAGRELVDSESERDRECVFARFECGRA
jgi:hypothetical protein